MAFTTAGLTSGGNTTHYHLQYDDSLRRGAANPSGPEPDRTNAVIASAEADFTVIPAGSPGPRWTSPSG
jgi:hypothetical protein